MTGVLSKVEEARKKIEDMKKGIVNNGEGTPLSETPPEVTIDLPEAEAIPRTDQPPADNTWQHKYEVLQSKYDKEIKRVYDELRDVKELNKGLNATLENTNLLIAELSKEKKAEPAPKEEPKITKYSKLNPDEFAGYEEPIQKVVNTLNSVMEDADRLTLENTRLKGENETLKSEFGTVKDTATRASETVVKSSLDSFWGAVNSSTGFAKYNGDENGKGADPRWVNFLDSYDKSMMQYRTKILNSLNSLDSASFIQVVKEFESLIGKTSTKKSGLDSLVVPGKGADAPAGGNGGERFIPVTEQDMATARTMLQARKITPAQFKEVLGRYEKTIRGKAA